MKAGAFEPDWISPPGHTLGRLLEQHRLTVAAFARRVGVNEHTAKLLLVGEADITPTIAASLAELVGGSKAFWLDRESRYRAAVGRRHQRENTWLREIPLKEMIRFGWVPLARTQKEQVAACLRFFGASDVNDWRTTYADQLSIANFRTSPTFANQFGAVSAWLRKGQLLANALEHSKWNKRAFKEIIPDLRKLSRQKDPSTFVPRAQKLCASCGVAFVVARAPTGCRASGLTRFLSPDFALMMLSFRYLSDDHFWFSFFHEAGHLILHGEDEVFIEGVETTRSNKEQEANTFAATTLIPRQHEADLLELPLNRDAIVRFAVRVGVSPGIVVGQLQYRHRLEPHRLNSLKRRYTWQT